MSIIPWRFTGGSAAIQSARGEKKGGRLHIAAKAGCVLFGPYLDLPPGHCVARVNYSDGASGEIKMEISAERGTCVLVSGLFVLDPAGGTLALEADLPDFSENCEVRLFAKSRVKLEVIAVEIDVDRVIPTEAIHAGRPVGYESGKSYASKIESGFFERYMSGPNVMEVGYKGYYGQTVPIVPQAIGVDVGYPGYEGAHFPFADDSFDAIYSSHCFEHIGDWLGVLRDWYRMLKVGGYLVIVVPHQLLFERKRSLPSPINPDHKRFYTPRSLMTEIETALEENSYRVRHLIENDAGFDYSIMPYQGTDGCYEIELVIEKIAKPFWHADNGSVRAYPAGDFRTSLHKANPWEIELDLTQKNQCVIFGPYIGLNASDYVADFHFDWHGGAVPDLVLDVAQFGERTEMVQLRQGEHDYSTGRISIPFTNPTHGEIFEFRTYVGGANSTERASFKGVVVRYAGPHG